MFRENSPWRGRKWELQRCLKEYQKCNRPLYTGRQFWEFQYSKAHYQSKIFLQLLRDLTQPLQSSKYVFTYGDVYLRNIMVERNNSGKYHISSLIDWKISGFYPKYFKCTKITNCLTTNKTNDWYPYLPICISPAAYVSRWLSDSKWDIFVAWYKNGLLSRIVAIHS